MVRVNTRVSTTVNAWLDEYSNRTGMPKSTIVFLAIENFKRDNEALQGMQNMNSILERLEQLPNEINEAVQRSIVKS